MSSDTRKKACSYEDIMNAHKRPLGSKTHQFDTPAKQSRLEVLIVRQCPPLDDLDCVHHRQSTVQLPSWYIVLKVLEDFESATSSRMRSPRAKYGYDARGVH